MSKHSLTLTCADSDDDAAAEHLSMAMDLVLAILNRDTDFGAFEAWTLEYTNVDTTRINMSPIPEDDVLACVFCNGVDKHGDDCTAPHRLENTGPKRNLFLRVTVPERANLPSGFDYAVEDHEVIDVISDALIEQYLADPYVTVVQP